MSSATEVYLYQVYCTTENAYVLQWGETEPTTCPNNTAHTINPALTTIIRTISTRTVKAAEDSEGYFETGNIVVNVASGTPGSVTPHDVTWPYKILLWKTILSITTDMLGDTISVVASPNTTIGVIVAPAAIAQTTFPVNSTVIQNILRGFLVNLYDGVNNDVLGVCTNIDRVNNTISVETGPTHSFNAGSAIQVGVYVLKNIVCHDTTPISIGDKGSKGKTIEPYQILRIYYTNNSGTSKTVYYRYECYNMGE